MIVSYLIRLVTDNMQVTHGPAVKAIRGEIWDGVIDLDLADGTTVRINVERPAPTE